MNKTQTWCLTCGQNERATERCETLEAQLEVLTKCDKQICGNVELSWCQGCKNKKLVEGVKSE